MSFNLPCGRLTDATVQLLRSSLFKDQLRTRHRSRPLAVKGFPGWGVDWSTCSEEQGVVKALRARLERQDHLSFLPGALTDRGSKRGWQRPRTRTQMHLSSATSLWSRCPRGGREELHSFLPPSAAGAHRDTDLSRLSQVTKDPATGGQGL